MKTHLTLLFLTLLCGMGKAQSGGPIAPHMYDQIRAYLGEEFWGGKLINYDRLKSIAHCNGSAELCAKNKGRYHGKFYFNKPENNIEYEIDDYSQVSDFWYEDDGQTMVATNVSRSRNRKGLSYFDEFGRLYRMSFQIDNTVFKERLVAYSEGFTKAIVYDIESATGDSILEAEIVFYPETRSISVRSPNSFYDAMDRNQTTYISPTTSYEVLNKYSPMGFLIEKVRLINGVAQDRFEYSYDKQGVLSKEIQFPKPSAFDKFFGPESGAIITSEYNEHDEFGNWTKKTTRYSDGSEVYEQREVEYYP